MRLPTVLVALLFLVVVSPCAAQPTIWQRARNPETQRAYDVLTEAEEKILADDSGPLDLLRQHQTYLELVALLDRADALSLPDSRLWFLAADVYSNALVGRYRDARLAVERALAADPDGPLAGNGWFLLGVVCAKLEDPTCEIDAYSRALELSSDRSLRANIFLNRGESQMVLGNLDAAVADYRQSVRLANRMDLVSLAYYGLGIALERRGDLPSALVAMRRARANWPALAPYTALDQPSVFFVPAYDIYYYKALEQMALAQAASRAHDSEREQLHLREAIADWSSYISEAESAGHEYLSNAKLHRQSCIRDLNRSLQPAAGHASAR